MRYTYIQGVDCMRKSKLRVSDKAIASTIYSINRPLEDGVMVIPIAPEQREEAKMEMKEYINRRKLKEDISN